MLVESSVGSGMHGGVHVRGLCVGGYAYEVTYAGVRNIKRSLPTA